MIDTLLGDFASKLKKAHPRWVEEVNEWPLPAIISDYDATMEALDKLFVVRNILTHELPRETFFNLSEIDELVEATQRFISATDWLVVEELHGSIPYTQLAMNVSAAKELKIQEALLAEELGKVKALPGIDPTKLLEVHDAWQHFVELQAGLISSQVEGGTLYPTIFAGEKAEMVKERIEQLARIKKEWMDQ